MSNLTKQFLYDFINDVSRVLIGQGLLAFMVSLNLGIAIANFPIFAGEYEELDPSWYNEVGTAIVMTI